MRVLHLIPFDGIGGVESAARSMPDGSYPQIEFRKIYLASNRSGLNKPSGYWTAVSTVLSLKPDLVIGSLWRCYLVLILVKLFSPRQRIITFLHYPQDVHWVDWLASRISMALSSAIWADSNATTKRVPSGMKHKTRVISMLVERLPAFSPPSAEPRFIFWGRLHHQKGLLKALDVFARVQKELPEAKFCLIGPDAGAKAELEAEVKRLNLHNVWFEGPASRDAILAVARQYSFFLQPSENEGASMSVMEAMQLGLVPVVTQVGEMAHYCIPRQNAIVGAEPYYMAEDILRLLEAPDVYARFSQRAHQFWSDKPLYREDVTQQCFAPASPQSAFQERRSSR